MTARCSIIIRSRNEERWIGLCLKGVFSQEYPNFEVILVDNASDDKTLEKAKAFGLETVLSIESYRAGMALNFGIEAATGEYIVCLSAHCIPANNYWLGNLVSALEEDSTCAGVYGRQEPMSFSSKADKRDLSVVFGLDRKVQRKDNFFHNANSIIRRSCWNEVPFDSKISNIEDRMWAQQMLSRGYFLLYEPSASVFHYHGIHQDGDEERLKNVVNIIETQDKTYRAGRVSPDSMAIAAIIPVRGESVEIGGRPLLAHTIEAALASEYIDKVIVSTDNEFNVSVATEMGVDCPITRPKELSEAHVNLDMVQQYTLEELEGKGYIPDLVVHLEETFPFRPNGLIDQMLLELLEQGYDTVIAGKREKGFLWQQAPDLSFKQLDSGDVPGQFKEKTYIGLHGLCCITYPQFIRAGSLVGNNIGIHEVDYPLSAIEVSRSYAEVFSRIPIIK